MCLEHRTHQSAIIICVTGVSNRLLLYGTVGAEISISSTDILKSLCCHFLFVADWETVYSFPRIKTISHRWNSAILFVLQKSFNWLFNKNRKFTQTHDHMVKQKFVRSIICSFIRSTDIIFWWNPFGDAINRFPHT